MLTKFHNRSSFRNDPLSAEELEKAFLALVRHAQDWSFHDDIVALKAGKPVNRRSRLYYLTPMLDETKCSLYLNNASVSVNKRRSMIIHSRASNTSSPFLQLHARHVFPCRVVFYHRFYA